MPRHDSRRGSAAAARAPQEERHEPQTIPGGAAGVVDAADNTPRFQPELLRQQDGERYRQARRFMVVDGPRDASSGKIRYNDRVCGLVTISPGKEVTENSHDLAHLRSQGIRLELIPDIIEEESPEVAQLQEGETGTEEGDDEGGEGS